MKLVGDVVEIDGRRPEMAMVLLSLTDGRWIRVPVLPGELGVFRLYARISMVFEEVREP